MDEEVRRIVADLRKSKEKISVETFNNKQKCPIITFNGPFDPSYGIKVNKSLRINKSDRITINKLLGKNMNSYMIQVCNDLKSFKPGSYLKKKELRFKKEVNKKITKQIFDNGMYRQALINQFYGEHDRFNVNKDQRKFFEIFGKKE
jgi:hypothetical protein